MHHDAAVSEGTHCSPTAWHLCWQSAVGRQFFPHPSLHARIRNRLIDAHRRRGRALVDYCMLPTEIHVIAQLSTGETPGDVARAIGNVVARWVREAQPIRSPVLAGPFHTHALASDLDLRREVRMLGWRPVAVGLCRGPTYHPHGALRIALGMTPAHGFDSRPLLHAFGDTVSEARAALRAWIAHRPSDRDWRTWELARGLALVHGSVGSQPTMAREVRSSDAAALIATGGTDGIDGALRLLADWVTVKLGGPCAVDLHKGVDSVAARGRALVGQIAIDHALCSAASVARYFGRAKATLSEQMTASRARQADLQIVTTPVHRIIEDMAALDAVAKAPVRKLV